MSVDFIAAVEFLRRQDARGALAYDEAEAIREVLDHVEDLERERSQLERLLSHERAKQAQ